MMMVIDGDDDGDDDDDDDDDNDDGDDDDGDDDGSLSKDKQNTRSLECQEQ